ncbi:MAG: hypothetical protein M3N26_05415 [Pseudomonadota bacterium]|nr:hypothetical protein [Pseudomonadota bacterium]
MSSDVLIENGSTFLKRPAITAVLRRVEAANSNPTGAATKNSWRLENFLASLAGFGEMWQQSSNLPLIEEVTS